MVGVFTREELHDGNKLSLVEIFRYILGANKEVLYVFYV